MSELKPRHVLLDDLRRTMAGFVGQTFTEEMRQCIRMGATELMNTAYAEGQAAMAPLVCSNVGTSFCRQTEDCIGAEEYDEAVCRLCNLDGGFSI